MNSITKNRKNKTSLQIFINKESNVINNNSIWHCCVNREKKKEKRKDTFKNNYKKKETTKEKLYKFHPRLKKTERFIQK